MHLWMAECHIPFSGHFDFDLVCRIIVFRTYLILFEMGIPNLLCGCILGWWSVVYHLRVTVTLNLTFDLVFRIIISGAYLFYHLR